LKKTKKQKVNKLKQTVFVQYKKDKITSKKAQENDTTRRPRYRGLRGELSTLYYSRNANEL